MMHETDEMRKKADKIQADYDDGFDVMNRINAYIKKYLIPYCEDCKTEFVTPKHDCEEIQQRRQDDGNIEEYMDFI